MRAPYGGLQKPPTSCVSPYRGSTSRRNSSVSQESRLPSINGCPGTSLPHGAKGNRSPQEQRPESMALILGLVALLCLAAAGPCSASLAVQGAELSTGLRLQFPAQAERSYCLLTDPCVHVNALMGQAPAPHALTWVGGVGIRSGAHALSLLAEIPRGSRKAALVRGTLDEADITANLTRGEGARSEDGTLAVGVIEEGQLLLVTLSACGLRLLVRLQALSSKGGGAVVPHFVVDTLDWQNLSGPHGIVGQTFPNRALPHTFAGGPYHVATPASPAAWLAAPGAPEMSHEAALEQQRVRAQRHAALDGAPDDYLTSGLLEPNCAFSRFQVAGAAAEASGVPLLKGTAHVEMGQAARGVAGLEGLVGEGSEPREEQGGASSDVFSGDDHDIEEAWELAAHAASTVRSALASWWSRPSRAAGQQEHQEPQLRSLGRKAGSLSASDLTLIGETQGTREEAAEGDAVSEGAGSQAEQSAAGAEGRGEAKVWPGVASVSSAAFSEEVDVRDEEDNDNTVRAGAWSSHPGAVGVRGQDLELLAEMQGTQDGIDTPQAVQAETDGAQDSADHSHPKPRSSMSPETIQVLAKMQGTAETDLRTQELEASDEEASGTEAS